MYDPVPERPHLEYWLVTVCSDNGKPFTCPGGIHELEEDIDPF